MIIPVWATVILLACALFVLWRHVLPKLPYAVAAFIGFFLHLRAAKAVDVHRGPIWAHAPHFILRAYQTRMQYQTTLRYPDLDFNYSKGIVNNITKGERWLDSMAHLLSMGSHYGNVTVIKNEPDLKVNETMEFVIGVLPGNEDYAPLRALILHPMSSVVESVIGFDLVKLQRTVNHYMPDVEAVVVFDPRSLVDKQWNTITYLAAVNGSLYGEWYDVDHLLFKMPKDEK